VHHCLGWCTHRRNPRLLLVHAHVVMVLMDLRWGIIQISDTVSLAVHHWEGLVLADVEKGASGM